MIKNKKILITGGCGFIGSHLITHLAPDNEITVYDNQRRNALKLFDVSNNNNVNIIIADIRDKKRLSEAIKGQQFIIHLAAMAGVSTYYKSPVDTMSVNMQGTINIMDLFPDSCERFIDFSTSEVYGPNAHYVDETMATTQGNVKDARWTYAVSKIASEHLCFAYHKQYQYPIVAIRPFNIYGPGQVGEGAIHAFITRVLEGENLQVTGDGTQVRAWCYIDDLIAGTLAALTTQQINGETFNIGNPQGITILELAQTIISSMNSTVAIDFIEHLGIDIQLRSPNIEKATKMLGYCPKVTLREGLEKTIAWYKKSCALEK